MRITLIIDERSVSEHSGVSFRINPAKKHEENPVMLPGEPHQWDSLQVIWPATVLFDKETQKFTCWYLGLDAKQRPDRRWVAGYAESADGIHWIKPILGMVMYEGQDTNIIEASWEPHLSHHLSFVCKNPLPGIPESQKYISYWTSVGEKMSFLGKTLAYSPDGIHWTRESVAYEGVPFHRPSLQDITQLLYEPEEADPKFRFKGYSQILATRSYDGRKNVRHIGLVHGESFEKMADAADPVVLEPLKGVDEELHFATVKKIGGTYLMLFESNHFSSNPIRGDLRLAVSEDGREFSRVHPDQALVNRGSKGMWDENLLVTTTASMQEAGDTVYIFYIGAPNVYNSWPPEYSTGNRRNGSMFYPTYLGVALLPKDRYAYAAGAGSVTTFPCRFEQQTRLWLNTDDLRLIAEALDESGEIMATGKVVNETRNTYYRRVSWDRTLPAGQMRLRIHLSPEGKLYSLGLCDGE